MPASPTQLFLFVASRRDKISQRLFEIDEPGEVVIAFFFIRAFFENHDTGIHIGFGKPTLYLGFDDRDDLVIFKKKFL